MMASSSPLWIAFRSDGNIKLAPFRDRSTVGSTMSNTIALEGHGVRPLHGQFFVESDSYRFRDFLDRSIYILDGGSEIPIGSWKASLGSVFEFQNRFRPQILDSFRQILKDPKVGFDLERALEQVHRFFFLAAPRLPDSLDEMLRKQFSELSLLGPIEYLLKIPDITDILVESHDHIWIEQAGVLKLSDCRFSSDESYNIYLENLLTKLHKTIDECSPFLDFVLPEGSRGHLIIPPVTSGPKYLSIRKTRDNYFSLSDLLSLEMFSEPAFQTLKNALVEQKNILVSGATGSGKTTLMRALINECHGDERILILEDTPELKLPRNNTVFLQTRIDAASKLPAVGLRDLVRQCLRMRPDRIVVGEVRGHEALDLLHAMNTGHRGCLGSLHSNSARDALFRLQGLIQMSDASLSESVTRDLISRNIHLVLHCGRAKGGPRKLSEMGWIRGIDQDRILMEIRESP